MTGIFILNTDSGADCLASVHLHYRGAHVLASLMTTAVKGCPADAGFLYDEVAMLKGYDIEVEVLFCPMLPIYKREFLFWKFPRLFLFVFLVGATCT
jgi:hypothetical protein